MVEHKVGDRGHKRSIFVAEQVYDCGHEMDCLWPNRICKMVATKGIFLGPNMCIIAATKGIGYGRTEGL
jgi:hypothetical protein